MKYIVKRYWELCDTVEVVATSVSKAIELAHELPTNNAKSEYVPDSMNTDPDSEVWPVTTGGDS